jgi:hypothetical protein
MLFYGHLGAGANLHQGMLATVKNASLARLFAGGLVGPVAACLCILGFWHVYLNVRPSVARIGQIMFAAFFVLMVFGSAIHTLWTAKGLAIKYCYGNEDAGCHALMQAMSNRALTCLRLDRAYQSVVFHQVVCGDQSASAHPAPASLLPGNGL